MTKSKKRKFNILPLVIFFIAALFRFYNPNWDNGFLFHPDERNIAASVSRIRFFSQMNPQFFAYGSFPIYLYRVTGDLIDKYFPARTGWTYDWEKINVIGRTWSAFFSALTLLFLYKIVRKVFDEKTAQLALFFCGFTVFLIQTAHYAVTESLLAFFVILIIYLSLQFWEKPTLLRTIKLAVVCGLAISTKVSALTFFLIPSLVFLFLIMSNLVAKKFDRFFDDLFKALTFFILSFLIFFIVSPYIFLDFANFKGSMDYEGGIVTGKLIVVYVFQFIKTMPYIYWVKNWFYTQGPFLAVSSILGVVYFIWFVLKTRKFPHFLLLVWPLVYFAIVGRWFTKFSRYLVPLYPFLAIFAAKLWIDILSVLKKKKYLFNLSKFLLGMVVASTVFYVFAFMSVYLTPQTRIMASEWVYIHIPPGSRVLNEHWDDGLPLPLKGRDPSSFDIESLTIYEPDNESKLNYYADKLSSADYIIINSRRLYGTLMYLPEKYPLTSKYYQMLFSGQLGYQLAAQFTSYPRIGIGKWKLEFNDDGSEETFQVYDHPKVLIFKNMQRINRQEIMNILNS